VRETLARYIIEQARHGELDERRLRDGALLHLAQSNLRRASGDRAPMTGPEAQARKRE
jgi:hypothetical protein